MQGGIYGKQIDNLALIILIPLRITEEKPFSKPVYSCNDSRKSLRYHPKMISQFGVFLESIIKPSFT
jgi:hypothetical protein